MTSRIKLLPENLINRIAAGEVVERPASILKELVENSLDAGATRIEIDIEGGGKKLIRVTDNGCGLNKEELFLCLERHATSKLTDESDLFSIATLGFRGEALPSIASVAKMTITSQAGQGDGHRLKVEGGRIMDLAPAPTNQGTVIEVRDLFFNVPARRKFLKTEATETAHLVEMAQKYALSRPGLRLRLIDGGREVLSVDEHNDMAARILKILGRDVASSLASFQMEDGDLKISGYLGAPTTAARTNSSLFVFVLGRPVRDRLLNKAVLQGYGRTIAPGRWPAGLIFIELDPERVDVNVHPAKTEVRFREPGQVFDSLLKAVTRAIDVSPIATAAGQAPARPGPSGVDDDLPNYRSLDPPSSPNRLFGPATGQASPSNLGRLFDAPEPRGDGKRWQGPYFSMGQPQKGKASVPQPPLPAPPWMAGGQASEDQGLPGHEEPRAGPPMGGPGPAGDLAGIRPLAQLHRSYILAEGPTALYIIDQHAAHERVIFNSLKKTLKMSGLPSQGLLLTQTMEFGPQEALAAQALGEPLARLGFRLEPFGGSSWTLRGIPSLLDPHGASEALAEILQAAKRRLRDLDGAGLESVVEELSGSWLYSLACRAAIKAGQPMEREEMESLIAALAETEAGGFCPHGRPSTIALSLKELQKRFGRI
ncbi:MAG: DNA mismatch repair endonuclease MutL [Deltaproteobacteria bacterium]|jgi:DNA mismatch repair protein MutL|nr:DNA mismatch repair endonuclease MutL [Deltaproteobacteria bacterium]